jgi:hypothetical protein
MSLDRERGGGDFALGLPRPTSMSAVAPLRHETDAVGDTVPRGVDVWERMNRPELLTQGSLQPPKPPRDHAQTDSVACSMAVNLCMITGSFGEEQPDRLPSRLTSRKYTRSHGEVPGTDDLEKVKARRRTPLSWAFSGPCWSG